MKTIHKFPLIIADEQIIIMPANPTILCVQVQAGVPCLWAEVRTDFMKAGQLIRVYGTGHEIPEANQKYIGTIQMSSLVYHFYQSI